MQCCRRALPRHAAFKRPFITPGERTIFQWLRKIRGQQPEKASEVNEDNLFFPLSSSPFPDLRARSQTIKRMCRCPVCLSSSQGVKNAGPASNVQNLVTFDCPDCGYPTHCSQEHWEQDTEHRKYCGRLREVNEDDHDLRSPRPKREYDFPGGTPQNFCLNTTLTWSLRGPAI